MDDKHIKLEQIGSINKTDENGLFSAGYSYINPNNILYLEEIRKVEEWTYSKLLSTYDKDPDLKDICWWSLQHYIGLNEYTDSPKKLKNTG